MNQIRIAITQGDFNGVGLEVALKSLADETMLELVTPLLFADWRLVEFARKSFGLELPPMVRLQSAEDAEDGRINVIDLRLPDTTVQPGKPTPASGAGAVASLQTAMQAVLDGEADALVTAPICKENACSEAFPYAGHTEYLGAVAGEDYKPQMILFDDHARVALVTTHLPLAEVPAAITDDAVTAGIRALNTSLCRDFGIACPRIAVLSLNPHAGDGGLLGREEIEIITPTVAKCAAEGLLVFGPYAADGFFGSGTFARFDGILAMYHDQGLAPFKTLAGSGGVNFTAGLPFVRTSPDHGTAFDIAWKGEADPASMREAIYRAIDILRCRRRHDEASANPLRKFERKEEKNEKNEKREERGERRGEKTKPEEQ